MEFKVININQSFNYENPFYVKTRFLLCSFQPSGLAVLVSLDWEAARQDPDVLSLDKRRKPF